MNITATGWRAASALAFVTIATATVGAIYAPNDVQQVPVARITENLERLLAAKPKDPQLLLNLARTHAMAFSLAADVVDVYRGAEASGAWYGNDGFAAPSKPRTPANAAAAAAAREQLKKAIVRYEELVAVDPNHLVGRLGLAWTIEMSGDKPRAIQLYRAVIKDAWVNEQRMRSLGVSGQPVTVEASGYLIPLLDPEKDKAEIATLRSQVAQLARLPRAVTPLAIPLSSRPVADAWDVVDRTVRVRFDADGSGLAREWTWIRPDVGWLAYDHHDTGRIESSLQLFGSVTFWLFWRTGFDALAALDDNGDRRIDGQELRHLVVWRDANQNGVSDRGEVRPVEDWGIVSLSCESEIDDSGAAVAYSPAGVRFRSGETRPIYDVLLTR